MLHNHFWGPVVAIGMLTCTLAACTQDEQPRPEPTTSTAPTTSSVASSTSASSSSNTATSTTSTSKTTAETSRTTTADSSQDESVQKAYKQFGSLAPKSLFDQLESCMPGGVDKSMQCSGPEVGQFQFFESENKAITTTQLLTGLDSSRIVERDGGKMVGWSSLGSTAVITVVDADRGLVMQQMMSADKQEPKDRIIELGLVKNSSDDNSDTDQEQVETSEPSE